QIVTRILEVNPEQRRMRLSLSALEPEPEPEIITEPVQHEEKEFAKPEPKHEKAEHTEKPERREKKAKNRVRALKEAAGYEDDDEMAYNPFAEAFKDADWGNE
ncbi:MAG: hypothetical protein IJM82_03100, partial [Synergistaceae bacterium]|nr:hypothetical protein [Synergistaceae bacterium]